MIFVIVILYILLNDCLELRISIRIGGGFAIFLVQDIVGHISAPHLLGIFLDVVLNVFVSLLITSSVGIITGQDDMQFSILQGLKFQHCPAGLLRTFSICADGCAAETELPLDFSQRSPFCELPDDYS